MARPHVSTAPNRLLVLVSMVVVVGVLYFAQEVLIPFALSVLIAFLLAPVVARLEKWGLHRIAAVIVVSLATFAAIGGVGYVVVGQLFQLVDQIPRYKDNIRDKIEAIRGRGGSLNKVAAVVEDLANETASETQPTSQPATQTASAEAVGLPPSKPIESIAAPGSPPAPTIRDPRRPPPVASGGGDGGVGTSSTGRVPETAATLPAAAPKPLPVEVHQPPPSPLEYLRNTLTPIVGPLGTAGIVVVFVVFMLIYREDLRNRLIRLTGKSRVTVTTQAIDDASKRVSRYLLMNLIVNVTYGFPIGVGLGVIGVPNAFLWGLLATLLRFIPYIGPFISASMPVALSLAVFPEWKQPLLVVGWFIVVELISNNVVEPWLYGKGTGVSPMAVITAALFWAWLWGPIGLLLSTPLTVCVAVLGKYIPRLEFLGVLLGDEPALEPKTRFYQRLLSLDADEAVKLAEEYLKTNSLLAVYDHVLLPALHLAEHDRHQGFLDEEREEFIYEQMKEIITDLGEADRRMAADRRARADQALGAEPVKPAHGPARRPAAKNGKLPGPPEPARAGATCEAQAVKTGAEDLPAGPLAASDPIPEVQALCLPARDVADEMAALMLAQTLQTRGIKAQASSVENLASEMLGQVEQAKPIVVCVSAMPPSAVSHARYLCKRVSLRYPGLPIHVGLWNFTGDTDRAKERLTASGASETATTLAQAIDRICLEVQHGQSLVSARRPLQPADAAQPA